MVETDTDRILLDCIKVSCPYCGVDLLPLTAWDGCRPDALKSVACGACGSAYYIRQPSMALVYPAEFVQPEKDGVNLVTHDKERAAAFLKRREGLQDEKNSGCTDQ